MEPGGSPQSSARCLLLTLFVGAQAVFADEPHRASWVSLPEHVALHCQRRQNPDMTVMNTPACLDDRHPGTDLYADVQVLAEILTTATARYDIGLWVALEGGSANTGPGNQCYHGILTSAGDQPAPPSRTTVRTAISMEITVATRRE